MENIIKIVGILFLLYAVYNLYWLCRLKIWRRWIERHSLYEVMLKRDRFKRRFYSIRKSWFMSLFDDVLYQLSCNLPSYDMVVEAHTKFPEIAIEQVTEHQLILAGKTPGRNEIFSGYSKLKFMVSEDCLWGINLMSSLTICADVRELYLDAEDSEILAKRWRKSLLTINDAFSLLAFVKHCSELALDVLNIGEGVCFWAKDLNGKLQAFQIRNNALSELTEDEARNCGSFCFIVKY